MPKTYTGAKKGKKNHFFIENFKKKWKYYNYGTDTTPNILAGPP